MKREARGSGLKREEREVSRFQEGGEKGLKREARGLGLKREEREV